MSAPAPSTPDPSAARPADAAASRADGAFVVLVPVKPPAVGKSRLVGLPDEQRRRLAAAFALDTVTAALGTPAVAEVLVVTDDARFAAQLSAAGCSVLPDGAGHDLNASLEQTAAEARRRWPGLVPAVLCADLPSLRSVDLQAALEQAHEEVAAGHSCFVADRVGVGTTMYAAAHADFAPRFGGSSRAAHLAGGAREIEGTLTSLRSDVDEPGDLGRALVLGVGHHTAEATGRA
ncbi:2-phospho-L-lactate guanylyltransferase [Nocardioides pacificus]